MDWKITDVRETSRMDPKRGLERIKKVYFDVRGNPHTLEISMRDFDEGKIKDLVEREANKILDAYKTK